jgi:NAD(P)-dependent dehydrogenase (short-subunit alcohol dehydrogenase family)
MRLRDNVALEHRVPGFEGRVGSLGESHGVILNVASVSGLKGNPSNAAYNVAKAGMMGRRCDGRRLNRAGKPRRT